MNTRGHTVRHLIRLALTGLFAVTVHAGSGVKTDTATMNEAADWSAGALGTGDTGTFDNTISSDNATNLTLGADLSIGALVFNNNLNGPVIIGSGNTLTLNSTGTGLDLSAANQNVTINCAVALPASQTWNVGGGRTLTLGGALTNLVGILTKTGDGQLVVGNVIKDGQFTLKSDGGSLVVNGDISQSPHPTANSFYLDGTANGTVNGSIDDVYALRKNGTGTWTLTGNNPLIYTETGSRAGVEINVGALNVQHAGALGSDNGLTVSSVAALEVQGGITLANTGNWNLYGTGISSGGALRNISGNNTVKGKITLGSASRINSDAGTLTIDVASGNAIAGAFDLTIGGDGNVVIADPIAIGAGQLSKDGAGTLTLGPLAGGGDVDLSVGTLAIKIGAGADEYSQLKVGSGVTVTLGGTLTIDDSACGECAGREITIVNVSALGGTRSGVFSNYAEGDTYHGSAGLWTVHYDGANGDVELARRPPPGMVVTVR